MVKLRLSLKKVLYWMLSLTLLIDFVNGIVPQAHIGEICRIALLLLCMVIAYKKKRNTFLKFVLWGCFLAVNITISMIVSGAGAISTDIAAGIKTLIVFFVANALVIVFRDASYEIDNILRNNLIYGPGLFILTKIIGLGRDSYIFSGNAVGFKSVFLSLNSINVAFLILFIYSISKIHSEKKTGLWIAASIYTMIPLLMLGTKTSYAMIVIVPVFFAFINSRRKKTWLFALVAIVALLGIISVFGEKIYRLLEPSIRRQLYLFNQRNIWTYAISARNIMVTGAFQHYFDTFSIIDLIPGRGYYDVHYAVGRQLGIAASIPIEMDWADILVSYGLIGFFYTYAFSIKAIIRAWKVRKNRIIQGYFWAAVILLLYGSFAGHLFMEAISSTFYAIVIAGLMLKTTLIKKL